MTIAKIQLQHVIIVIIIFIVIVIITITMVIIIPVTIAIVIAIVIATVIIIIIISNSGLLYKEPNVQNMGHKTVNREPFAGLKMQYIDSVWMFEGLDLSLEGKHICCSCLVV